MENVIHGYVRDEKNRKVGILVGVKCSNGSVIIGGAKARTKVDKFNADEGYAIAMDRVKLSEMNVRPVSLPACMWEDTQHFADRCRRYFCTDKIILPVIKSYQKSK